MKPLREGRDHAAFQRRKICTCLVASPRSSRSAGCAQLPALMIHEKTRALGLAQTHQLRSPGSDPGWFSTATTAVTAALPRRRLSHLGPGTSWHHCARVTDGVRDRLEGNLQLSFPGRSCCGTRKPVCIPCPPLPSLVRDADSAVPPQPRSRDGSAGLNARPLPGKRCRPR